MYNLTYSIDPKSLVNYLITMKPFIPNLCHEILRLSNYGVSMNLRNILGNISTINIYTFFGHDARSRLENYKMDKR